MTENYGVCPTHDLYIIDISLSGISPIIQSNRYTIISTHTLINLICWRSRRPPLVRNVSFLSKPWLSSSHKI